jgi:hypothetical protein
MFKYHYKIYDFLKDYLNKYDCVESNLDNKNKSLELIIKSVNNAFNLKYDIKLLETSKIHKLHTSQEPPLMYLYLKELKIYTGKFKEFVDWYNTNIHKLTIPQNTDNKYGKILFVPIPERQLLHSIYDNKFVCIDIHQEIETTDIIHEKYIIDNKHNIDLFLFEHSKIYPDMEKVAKIITVIKTLAKKDYDVNLIIIFSEQKKIIQNNTEILCCNHINSGSTYHTKIITCFRREEFYKVLMHELIHYYQLDFHFTSNYYKKLEAILDVPDIIGIDRLNESYTESLTILIMSCFMYYYNNFDKPIKYYINKEIIFSLFQLAKILKLFGASKFDDYLDKKIIIKQHTSVRSYFFIKTFLLLNLKDFLEFLDDSFYVNNIRLIEFGKLINTSYKQLKDEHKQIIDYFINIKNDDGDTWIVITSRLSSF